MCLPGLPNGIKDFASMLGMAENLVPQFASVSGAADNNRYTLIVADPRRGEPEPCKILKIRLVRRGPR